MKTNQEYKNIALNALKGNWANAVIVTIIFILLASIIYSPGIADDLSSVYSVFGMIPPFVIYGGTLLVILVLNPLTMGFYNSFLLLLESGDNRLTANMFNIAFGKWIHNVLGILLMYVYIFLWSLLLVVPGIIKAYSYAMTPYILAEHPELSANEAIDRSRAMMKGHKFDYFFLQLSFIGWILLSIITLGVGMIWLMPYMYTTSAAFYSDLKSDGSETLDAERVL